MPRTITDVPASGTRRYRMGQYGSGTDAFPGFTKCAWPTAGKFLNLVFWVEDAPGEGNAFTLTMVLDGVETALTPAFHLVYTAADAGSGLTEREFDHVFVGRLEKPPRPDPDEIDALRWAEPREIERELIAAPGRYTPWFAQLFGRLPELLAARSA